MQQFRWSTIAPETVYPGITRQTIQGELQTVVRYIYQPGAVFPVHAHPQEQVTIVLSGAIEFTIGEETVELTSGGVAVIPANVPHGARVTSSGIVESFNTLSPARSVQPGNDSLQG